MIKKILLFTAIILVSLQIYGASAQTASDSSKVSGKITKKVVEVITTIKNVDAERLDTLYKTVHHVIRKTAHFLEYALLSFLVFLLTKCYNIKTSMCFLICLLYCLVFAGFDEWHQLSVEGRSGEIKDVLIDFCGSIAGSGSGCLLLHFFKEIKKHKAT